MLRLSPISWSTLSIAFFAAGAAHAAFPLFDEFPSLERKIPRIELIDEFTPIQPMRNLESLLHREAGQSPPEAPRLWVKRDDRSWTMTGGNKARKLEFLIGQALQKGATTLVTSGMYGSNHTLTTAAVANSLGLKARLVLGPMPVTDSVRKKLLASHALGAELRFHSNLLTMGVDLALQQIVAARPRSRLYYIKPGGSSIYGSLGYVNAFLELKQQVGSNALPNQIIVPVGTRGTAAGLLAGACLAGAWNQVTIIGVQTADAIVANERAVRRDAKRLWEFIYHQVDQRDRRKLKKCNFMGSSNAFRFIRGYFPPGYSLARPEVFKAISLVKDTERLTLEPTYSGKAMAHLLSKVREDLSKGKAVPNTLYWLTFNSYDLNELIQSHPWTDPTRPWRDLPQGFWQFFE